MTWLSLVKTRLAEARSTATSRREIHQSSGARVNPTIEISPVQR